MCTLSMARRKKELAPNQRLARAIVDQYQSKSVEDMQDALKDIFGPMFEAMLKGEMNSHLGYCNNERGEKDTPNRRNGWIFLYDEIALPEIWKSDVRKWKSSMRVYSRNALSRPYTSRMDFSCSASMLMMLI